MFTTAIHKRPLSFTAVNKHAVHDEEGRLHIGETIRAYLSRQRITATDFADKIGLSRGGLNHIFTQRGINTERLEQISRISGHDFFRYYSMEFDPDLGDEEFTNVLNEPTMNYGKQAPPPPKRSRVVLELEDGKVVGTATQEDKVIEKMLEFQQRQWQVLLKAMPDLAKTMAENPHMNPNNIDFQDDEND